MAKKTLIRIGIIIVSVLIAYNLYISFYDIKNSVDDMTLKISDHMDRDITINQNKKLDDVLVIFFTFSEKISGDDYVGLTTLHEGLNSKYKISDVLYEADSKDVFIENFETGKNNYLIIFGLDKKFDKIIIYSKTHGEIVMELENKNGFLEVLESSIKKLSITKYVLEDKDGNQTVGYIEPVTDNKIDYSGKINSGPRNIVLISSGLIVLIGFILSLQFTPENNLLERLFKRIVNHDNDDRDEV